MKDNDGEFCLMNGEAKLADKFDDTAIQKNKVVYEVIRIIDRVPLFMEDHYIRLKNSLKQLGIEMTITQKELSQQIEKTISSNSKRSCNVKVTVYQEDGRLNCLMYISKSYYPVKEEIENGVKVGLMNWERSDPNVKIINTVYKEKAARSIEEGKVFEVLLVNEQGRITEGSKSNVFFVRGNKVFTAPDEFVLKGVTRKYIIDACKNAGFELIETLIGIDTLNEIEGLFISGTSIKVLPVSEVNGKTFNSGKHPTIVAIRDQYDCMVEEYAKKNA